MSNFSEAVPSDKIYPEESIRPQDSFRFLMFDLVNNDTRQLARGLRFALVA